ncbi:MAG: hypothetical protein GY833_22500 [Aestuariibacter sp.]|nr:hypothetical protein [Aestuariibacter sp.]|tara:strand:+ start:254024 stop:255274 length:1251 start_codon:yes stop_codon:yes gene_type:complete
MGLILVLIIASFAIASSAAYFSVIGLAAMFSAAYWPVVVMGSSLELGKLVAASFVYRTWKTTGILMKTYLISAIFVLMLITSLGIFGFLSQGYGESTQKLQEVTYTIEVKQKEVMQVDERLEQINKTIADVPPQYITKRMELKADYAAEVSDLEQKRRDLQATMNALQKQKMEADAHVGPIIYVAEMFGVGVQDAVKFFIFALIIVFDPMAVILTLATNHAIQQYQIRRKTSLKESREHELALEHERSLTTEKEADSAPQSPEQQFDDVNDSGGMAATKDSAESLSASSEETSKDPVAVPTAIVQQASTRTPSISDMNAVLNKTPSRRDSIEGRKQKADDARNDKRMMSLGKTEVPMKLIESLGKPDQDLLYGVSKGVSKATLAAQLGMSELNFRKRCTYLATLLNNKGYSVNLVL